MFVLCCDSVTLTYWAMWSFRVLIWNRKDFLSIFAPCRAYQVTAWIFQTMHNVCFHAVFPLVNSFLSAIFRLATLNDFPLFFSQNCQTFPSLFAPNFLWNLFSLVPEIGDWASRTSASDHFCACPETEICSWSLFCSCVALKSPGWTSHCDLLTLIVIQRWMNPMKPIAVMLFLQLAFLPVIYERFFTEVNSHNVHWCLPSESTRATVGQQKGQQTFTCVLCCVSLVAWGKTSVFGQLCDQVIPFSFCWAKMTAGPFCP